MSDIWGLDELPADEYQQVTGGAYEYGDWLKHPLSGKWWRVHADWMGMHAWDVEGEPIEAGEIVMRQINEEQQK